MKNPLMPFGAGTAGWILGLLVLFGLAWPLSSSPDTVSNAVMWALRYWWAAFALGLVAVIVTAIIRKIPPLPSLLAYILPVAVMAVLAMVCILIYPDSGFREDLLSYMPVTVVFYIMSWLWIRFRKEGGAGMLRAVTPPVFGGIIILCLVAIPVFTSNAFIYRNAFTLDVLEVERPEKSLIAKCVLEIRKPGDYVFRSVPLYYFDMFETELTGEEEKLTCSVAWGEAGEPGPGASGKYPLEIRWTNIPEIDWMADAEMMDGGIPILLEAHAPGGHGEIIYTLSGREPEKPEKAAAVE